jgi:hypothetical protein
MQKAGFMKQFIDLFGGLQVAFCDPAFDSSTTADKRKARAK